MTALAMNNLAGPVRALRLLVEAFPDLPAMHVDVSTVFPDQLTLSSHNDLSLFEVWRDAVGISPDAVTYHELSSGTRVLEASTNYAGACLCLIGYTDTHRDEGGDS